MTTEFEPVSFDTPQPWHGLIALKLIKILATGTANHIGSHTFVALREAGFEPVILDNFRNSSRGLDNTSGLSPLLIRPC